jgi:hypothetical protein
MDLCLLQPETGVRIVAAKAILTPVLFPGDVHAL